MTASVMSPSMRDPQKVELHAYHYFDNLTNEMGGKGKFLHSWANGKLFPTGEAAWQFALEHSYIQIHVQAWCPRCRTLHRGRPIHIAGKRLKGGFVVRERTEIPLHGFIPLFDSPHWKAECERNLRNQPRK